MYIKKLTITNMGPFGRSRVSRSKGYSFKDGRHSFEFNRGSVGIFGENGVGKTSLVDLSYSAITGDFTRFDGVRTDCINSAVAGPGNKEEASVHVEFEHDGGEFALLRSVRPPRYELAIGNDKPISLAREGDAKLAALGINKNILDFCVFKRQPGSPSNSIDDFLRTTPALRAEAYQSLNQTEHCETIHAALTEMIAKDKDLQTEVVDDSDELLAQIGAAKAARDEHVAAVKKARELLLKDEHKDKAEEIVKKSQQLDDLKEQIYDVDRDSAKANDFLTDRCYRLQKKKAWLAEVEARLKGLAAKVKVSRDVVSQWKTFTKYRQRKQLLEAERKKLRQDRKEPPAGLDEDGDRDSLMREYTEMTTAVRAAKKRLEVFENTGLDVCPTCGTEVSAFLDDLIGARQLVDGSKKGLAELRSRIDAIDAWSVAYSEYKMWKAAYDEKVAANAEALAHLKGVEVPVGTVEEHEMVITAHADAETAFDVSIGRVGQAEQEAASAQATVDQLYRQREKLNKLAADCVFEEKVVAKAKERLHEHRQAEIEIASLKGRIGGVNDQIQVKEQELEALRAKLRRSKKLCRAVKILSRVRDAFHKQGLPQKVAQANLTLMEGDVNRGLELFGEPFWVEADDDLSFLVHKPGEEPHRAERLSGGQKIVLALAFWPAVNALYKSGMGLMVLDEPTANLDEANIAFLRDAVSRLTNQVRGKRQIIMISHADNLKTSFDQLIELRK